LFRNPCGTSNFLEFSGLFHCSIIKVQLPVMPNFSSFPSFSLFAFRTVCGASAKMIISPQVCYVNNYLKLFYNQFMDVLLFARIIIKMTDSQGLKPFESVIECTSITLRYYISL